MYFKTLDAGLVGLTPQERMQVRMHEKAKKKTAAKYSVEQLLEKVTLHNNWLQLNLLNVTFCSFYSC